MQLSLPAVRSNCSHRISSRVPPLQGTKALPSSRAGTANRVSKRPINFVQAAVGHSHVSDARKGQFLGPSIRVRGKGVFASPAHFRGRSGDHFDTPLLHGPAKFRGMSLANLATCPASTSNDFHDRCRKCKGVLGYRSLPGYPKSCCPCLPLQQNAGRSARWWRHPLVTTWSQTCPLFMPAAVLMNHPPWQRLLAHASCGAPLLLPSANHPHLKRLLHPAMAPLSSIASILVMKAPDVPALVPPTV